MASFYTLRAAGENETVIKKSRFICQLGRASDETEAQAFIAAVRQKHAKATHNVPVYLLGAHDEHQHSSDDGEPAGTAGVPMLRVLQAMQLHDVVAVTTRYFGGIKLGAGGLIRAYAGSVTAAVHRIGIVERVPQREVTLTLPYPALGAVQHHLAAIKQPIAHIDYTEAVTLHLAVTETALAALTADLTDLLNGPPALKLGRRVFAEVPVEPPTPRA